MRQQEHFHDFFNQSGRAGMGWRNRGGGAGPPLQILADQLTLSSPGGTDSAHQITTRNSIFSDIPPFLPI